MITLEKCTVSVIASILPSTVIANARMWEQQSALSLRVLVNARGNLIPLSLSGLTR